MWCRQRRLVLTSEAATPQHWPRKFRKAYISSTYWEEPQFQYPSWKLATEALLRAYCPAESWRGWKLFHLWQKNPAAHSECSWKDHKCPSPFSSGHLQQPPCLQSMQHYRWLHPTPTQFLHRLPPGRRFHGLQACTTRLKNSFIHQAVRMVSPLSPLSNHSTTP